MKDNKITIMIHNFDIITDDNIALKMNYTFRTTTKDDKITTMIYMYNFNIIMDNKRLTMDCKFNITTKDDKITTMNYSYNFAIIMDNKTNNKL
jgi:hypothetical protein